MLGKSRRQERENAPTSLLEGVFAHFRQTLRQHDVAEGRLQASFYGGIPISTALINWKHSGFSVDHSIRIQAFSISAREALSQYIARPPLSLKKISIEENGEGTVISYTSDNNFFKEKIESFSVPRFLLELTQYILPKGCQFIRRYGQYASRTKVKWPDKPHVIRRAPAGWKTEQQQAHQAIQPRYEESTVSDEESPCTWARLIAQVYEVDPLECTRCHSAMKVIAVITEPEEVRKILRPPAEDRPLTSRIRPSFAELAICPLPVRSGGSLYPRCVSCAS